MKKNMKHAVCAFRKMRYARQVRVLDGIQFLDKRNKML